MTRYYQVDRRTVASIGYEDPCRNMTIAAIIEKLLDEELPAHPVQAFASLDEEKKDIHNE